MADTKLKILGRGSSSNVQKVTWLLGELGKDYEREDYGGKYGRNKEPEYLQLNPNGVVPTMLDGEIVLWESNTICRYLASRCAATSLYPSEPDQRALCERWMDWQLGTLGPAMAPLFKAIVRAQGDPSAVGELRERAAAKFAILDRALSGREFLQGRHLTLADIANGPWTHRWFALGMGDGSMPDLEAWYGRLGQRSAYRGHVMAIPLE